MISERAAEIFSIAKALSDEERAAVVDEHCKGDAALREEVCALLAAEAGSEAFFSGLAGRISLDALTNTDEIMPEGKVIGQWRLSKRIGRGGMGAVYLATRVDGQFEQQVALKILPTGMDSDEARARFLIERQILAGLMHDNIARLLDGGVTADGVPYFVMDYVEGEPIDTYCDQQEIGLRGRLRLVLDVAKAVQFAHRNLVVHRDLKPSNVLVSEDGQVRLLDFGIAKMLDADHNRGLTQIAQRPATPAFSSPEMLRGDQVDVTTDVYSIGSLMYVLLTGDAPLRYDGMSVTEMRNHAATTVPAPMRSIRQGIPEELDAVVAKALSKAPAERYQSVESLALDIDNYLQGLPVTASPPSRLYRLKKFVGRHRLEVASAAFAVAALTVIAGLAIRSAITTERQATRIALERDRAEQTLSFLVSIFDAADPSISPGEQTAMQILQDGRQRLESELADQPAVQADLLKAMSHVYQNLRMPAEALEVLERENALRDGLNVADSPEYADVLIRLALATDLSGDYDQSLAYGQEALAISERVADDDLRALAHVRIGRIHHLQGRYDEAGNHYRLALALSLASTGPDSLAVAQERTHLGNLLNHQGNPEAAIVELERALVIRRANYASDHSDIVEVLLGLAPTFLSSGKLDEAETAFQSALAMNDRLHGADNSYNMYVHSGLGKVAEQRGDFGLAAQHFDDTARLVELHTPESPNLGFAYSYVGRANAELGKRGDAIESFRRAITILEDKLTDHWLLGDIRWRLGSQLAANGDFGEAEALILSGVATVTAQWGDDDARTLAAHAAAVSLYEAMGETEMAAAYR